MPTPSRSEVEGTRIDRKGGGRNPPPPDPPGATARGRQPGFPGDTMGGEEDGVMNATKVLKEEHGGVKIMLGILGKVCDRLKAGAAVPPADLDRILEFLRVFVDRCHHAKEEDFLFPAMERAGVGREGGPIGEMLSEHERGRKHVRGMGEAAEGCKRGDRDAAKRFVLEARGYIDLLLEHIEKEDGILYPMADEMLGEDADQTLVKNFDRVEDERVGHGRHEEFHRLMEELQTTYEA